MTGFKSFEHAGIIAAGEGTRLRTSHPTFPKPLVPVAGMPLCHWVINSLSQAGMKNLTVLLNSRGQAVRESLSSTFPTIRWSFLVQDTASSWESFRLVARALSEKSQSFIISTVDSLIPPAQVQRFTREALRRQAPAGLALTQFVDDEKPLWADLGPEGLITALGPQARLHTYATAGLYCLTREIVSQMPEAAAHDSLRNYWISLAKNHAALAGIVLSKTLDVDRPEDIQQAESFLKEKALW